MSPDADDVSPEPEFSGDQDDTENMAESLKDGTPAGKTESNASGSSDQQTPTNGHSKPNLKDPLRPRRKKARRACFACQRAHLTCGDERPCQRCIKRGLQDQCHDGVRKKAKYLHDAPAEALIPPGMSGYHHPYMNGTKASSVSSASGVPITGSTTAHTPSHYAPSQPPNMDIYSQATSQTQMPPPMQAHAGSSFGSQHAPMSPPYHSGGAPQQHNMATSMPQSSPNMQQQFNGGPLFDPSDPALFNFDIASLNFGNQYGALEFGMLNHMSSGANDGNGNEMMNQMNALPNYPQSYAESPAIMFGQDAMMNADWQTNHQRANSTTGLLATPNNTPIVSSIDRNDSLNGYPNAYTIGAGPNSLASASPATSVVGQEGAENPHSPAMFINPPPQQPSASPLFERHHKAQPVQPPQQPDFAQQAPPHPRKRPFDADTIYDTVTKPYAYTAGFHRLFNFISRRFSSEKRLRIAKAVSAIRPSLITFSQSLTNKDLVFMEISVQRKLYEYVDFINSYGTPTIITRRDGAIVAASKEFAILTGWSKGVLLGKEPNLNINTGGASGASTAPGSASRTRLSSAEVESRGQHPTSNPNVDNVSSNNPGQPALLAEIMDQDSVVRFYEEYAKLAFGDPRGFGLQSGRLLKYKTQAQADREAAEKEERVVNDSKKRKRTGSIKEPVIKVEDNRISSEAGFNKLGEKEGMVDVMCCWNVRRDVFEVPMLIVMNFLPII
ncbi:hypothetical protein EJ08DRAFT_451250 [Tothia fuscella]|uniref:Zn(2)-C6 fungal-type domain-containing protein n=1 Tax=Tothia fuscella TaxID=1048955 RepID=A0A9P4TUF5_9PEZI|nr:hypothetical protein EJ08DRAFT_451250 [Tothia fuscella]